MSVFTVGNTSNSGVKNASSTSSITHSHTVDSASDLLVVVTLVHSDDRGYTITYDGESMTSLTRATNANGGPYLVAQVHYLVNPSTGANNIVATASESKNAIVVAFDFAGANVNSVFNTQGVSETSGDPSLSIACGAGGLVVSGFTIDTNAAYAPQDSQTEVVDVGHTDTYTGRFVAGYKITSGVTSQRMKWAGTDDDFAQASASFDRILAGNRGYIIG